MTPADPAVANSWGLIVNSAWPCIEQTAAGISSIDLTGLGAYTLTVANDAADQARQAMLQFIGAPAGTCTVTIPNVARIGWVSNLTTNNTNVILTTGGVTNLTVTPGASYLYKTDGVSVSSVTIGAAGVTIASSGVQVGNNTYFSGLDPTNIPRNLLGIDGGNYTNLLMGGSMGWRVLNQAGTAAYLFIGPTGNATFSQGLTCQGPTVLQGTLSAGATTLASLTVSGATTYSGTTNYTTTLAATAGVIASGYDPGGMNLRFQGASFGAGWRIDNTGCYLVITPSGSPAGLYNALRPFTVNLSTGALFLDSTGAGTTFGGAVTTAALTSAAHIATSITATTGTVGAVSFPGGGVINSGSLVTAAGFTTAGTVTAQTATISGTVSAATANLTGNVNALGLIAANVSLTGTVAAVNGNFTGYIAANGGTTYAGNSGYLDAGGAHVGPYSVAVSVVANNGMGAAGFYASSDARVKTEIEDIDASQAYDWLRRARPRTYKMDGVARAGFVAQEDIAAGRGAAVKCLPDDNPMFADGDGIAPPGGRLVRDYEHDIPYLTAALNDAIGRILALEALVLELRMGR